MDSPKVQNTSTYDKNIGTGEFKSMREQIILETSYNNNPHDDEKSTK